MLCYCSRHSRLQVTCCPRVFFLPWIPFRILPFRGLDSYEEDSSGVYSMSLVWGLLCFLLVGQGLWVFGKRTPEVRWPSCQITSGQQTFVRHHGGCQPGHLAQVVSAKEGCSLSCSLVSLAATHEGSPPSWGWELSSGKTHCVVWNSMRRTDLWVCVCTLEGTQLHAVCLAAHLFQP